MKKSASAVSTLSRETGKSEEADLPANKNMSRSKSTVTTVSRRAYSIYRDGTNRCKALLVRLVLAAHFGLVVWRVYVFWPDWGSYLAFALVPYLFEGGYTILKRIGEERGVVSLCFLFYMLATVPGIWFLEIKRTTAYQNQNFTRVEKIAISGIDVPVRLSSNTWVLLVEETMLYLLICGKGVLPRGEMGREQLIQLLFSFISKASDAMELFSLFDEDSNIRHNTTLTYIILAAWSLSVLQFCLNFSLSHNLRQPSGPNSSRKLKRAVLILDLKANLASMFMQDGPFFAVRLYIIIQYQVITYSLLCFTIKNALVIILLLYQIVVVLNKLCCARKADDGETSYNEYSDNEKGEQDNVGRGIIQIPLEEWKNGPAPDAAKSGDLRKRKIFDEDWEKPIYFGPEAMGDLQKVIEGPATPARPMDKKNRSKYMVSGETKDTHNTKPSNGNGQGNNTTAEAKSVKNISSSESPSGQESAQKIGDFVESVDDQQNTATPIHPQSTPEHHLPQPVPDPKPSESSPAKTLTGINGPVSVDKEPKMKYYL